MDSVRLGEHRSSGLTIEQVLHSIHESDTAASVIQKLRWLKDNSFLGISQEEKRRILGAALKRQADIHYKQSIMTLAIVKELMTQEHATRSSR